MASSARAIRTGTSSAGSVVGRFAATFAAFRAVALKAGREAVLLDFLDMAQVPDGAALSGLNSRRKPCEGERGAALQLGPRRLYSARICPEPDLFRAQPVQPVSRGSPDVHSPRLCAGRGRRRYQQHVDVASAVRADL